MTRREHDEYTAILMAAILASCALGFALGALWVLIGGVGQ